ncbi:hypothetical protein [Nonomuraea aridisoli]|uniref:hypothetical protein n=1 Tax=Nonomuraea aridisoli TaxID=2070368 RepID=UPI0015E8AE91|nr:hypothetical protein [Nonomuraea aridisoli]
MGPLETALDRASGHVTARDAKRRRLQYMLEVFAAEELRAHAADIDAIERINES